MTDDLELLPSERSPSTAINRTRTECPFTPKEYDRLVKLMRSQEPSTVNGLPDMVMESLTIEGDQGEMKLRAVYRRIWRS